MVSAFLTSPHDHFLMICGEAMEIFIARNRCLWWELLVVWA